MAKTRRISATLKGKLVLFNEFQVKGTIEKLRESNPGVLHPNDRMKKENK